MHLFAVQQTAVGRMRRRSRRPRPPSPLTLSTISRRPVRCATSAIGGHVVQQARRRLVVDARDRVEPVFERGLDRGRIVALEPVGLRDASRGCRGSRPSARAGRRRRRCRGRARPSPTTEADHRLHGRRARAREQGRRRRSSATPKARTSFSRTRVCRARYSGSRWHWSSQSASARRTLAGTLIGPGFIRMKGIAAMALRPARARAKRRAISGGVCETRAMPFTLPGLDLHEQHRRALAAQERGQPVGEVGRVDALRAAVAGGRAPWPRAARCALTVRWPPVEPCASLSRTTWSRFFGAAAATLASAPAPISTLPSPSMHEDALVGPAQRDAEADRRGEAHGADHVEGRLAVLGGEDLAADHPVAGDDELVGHGLHHGAHGVSSKHRGSPCSR